MPSSLEKNSRSSSKNTKSTLGSWRSRVNNDLVKQQTFLSQRSKELKAVETLEEEIVALEKVQQIVQSTAAEVQGRIHRQIATVVTRCMKAVFGTDAYTFDIEFCKKRGKTEAVLSFQRNGLVVDPLDAAGGGVVDIASFALRLACILSSVPKLRRLVVLDEPFRHVALDLRPVALQLLNELSQELGVQFIVVSHFDVEDLNIGKVIKL